MPPVPHGLLGLQQSSTFDPSLMTHFRKRLGPDVLNQVNEWMIMAAKEDKGRATAAVERTLRVRMLGAKGLDNSYGM